MTPTTLLLAFLAGEAVVLALIVVLVWLLFRKGAQRDRARAKYQRLRYIDHARKRDEASYACTDAFVDEAMACFALQFDITSVELARIQAAREKRDKAHFDLYEDGEINA